MFPPSNELVNCRLPLFPLGVPPESSSPALTWNHTAVGGCIIGQFRISNIAEAEIQRQKIERTCTRSL